MNIEIHVRNYKSKMSGFYAKTAQAKDDLQSHQSALQEHIASFENRNILSKVFYFFPYALRKSSMENCIEELNLKISQFPGGQNDALRVLVLESARELMLKKMQPQVAKGQISSRTFEFASSISLVQICEM